MIHLDCREHLPCALATVDQLRRVNQQQADGWIATHNELTSLKHQAAELVAYAQGLDLEIHRTGAELEECAIENAELRRRLGEVGA